MHKSTSIVLLTIVLAACAGNTASQKGAPESPAASATAASAQSWLADGRSIFMTGRDADGRQITASPKALRSSCMQCHRANGSGGVHFADGAESADLRHKALVTDQKPPYTLQLLERAIATGVDNEGKPLDPVMPHWKMSSRDLHDVAQYVLTQLK